LVLAVGVADAQAADQSRGIPYGISDDAEPATERAIVEGDMLCVILTDADHPIA
jgi:hypothetical protein